MRAALEYLALAADFGLACLIAGVLIHFVVKRALRDWRPDG